MAQSGTLLMGIISSKVLWSGIISPPPSDPLDVDWKLFVDWSFTVGRLRSVPSHWLGAGETLYNDGELDFISHPFAEKDFYHGIESFDPSRA